MKREVFLIRNQILSSIETFYRNNGFIEVTPPVITPFSCEVACVGGSDLISVNYFDKKAFLSQSTQLYLESIALEFDKVFCVNPAFRAESTAVASHLTEFWMCEAEITNVTFDELLNNIEALIKYITNNVIINCRIDLESLGVNIEFLKKVIENKFPIITYTQALEVLKKENIDIEWGDEIDGSAEKIITEYCDNMPTFIIEYPAQNASFYKKQKDDNSNVVYSVDLIGPYGTREVVGGSISENNIDILKSKLESCGVNSEPYKWYLTNIQNSDKFVGGYGLGVERLVSWICGLDDIKDAIPFPRTENFIEP